MLNGSSLPLKCWTKELRLCSARREPAAVFSVCLPPAFQEETPAPMILLSAFCTTKVETEGQVINAEEEFSDLTGRFGKNKMIDLYAYNPSIPREV